MPPRTRAALLRAFPLLIRGTAIVAVVAIALGLRLFAVQHLPIDFDEDDYLRAGQQYAAAIQDGDPGAFTRENYRTEHPPLSKIAYGVALAGLPKAPLVADQPTTADPAASLPEPQLTVARTTAALFGTLEVAVLALVSPLAGLLLGIHTWDVKYTSQVMLEALPALLSLVTVAAFARGRRRLDRWTLLSAVALGLTAASKYLYCTAGIAVLVVWLAETRPAAPLTRAAAWRWLRPALAYVALALVVFVAADPYLWPDPVGRLWASITYHAGYAQSAAVADAGYPPWQPLVWLTASVPWSRDAFLVAVDIFVGVLALYGLRRTWRRHRVYAVWLAVSIVFLLLWPTKWPQYILVVTAPFSLAAAEGFAEKIGEPALRLIRGMRARALAWIRPAGPSAERPAARPGVPRHALRDSVRALPWLLPGTIALALLAAFPLLFQGAMALTDFTSQSIRDGLNGGVIREAVNGLAGQTPALPYEPFSGQASNVVHYAGPEMLVEAFNSLDGASLLVFDLLWTVLSVGLQLALGIGVALLLARRGVRFVGWWRAVFILPWAIPEFVGALAWRNVMDPAHGWFGLATGGAIDWASSVPGALIVSLIAATWAGWPLVFLAATAGLALMPADVQDAASVDGAGAWQRFRHITWPLLVPLLAPAVLIRVIFAFNQFYVFYVLATASPSGQFPLATLALTSFFVFDPTTGAGQFALSAVINILTVVVLVVLVLRLQGWQRRAEVAYA